MRSLYSFLVVTVDGFYEGPKISALKDQPGKDLAIFGSPRLTVSLVEMGLVDELRIMVQPSHWVPGSRCSTR